MDAVLQNMVHNHMVITLFNYPDWVKSKLYLKK